MTGTGGGGCSWSGVIWFALASVLCAISPNVAVLIGARILQGIGGVLDGTPVESDH